jgi:hypothetical protein
MNFKTPYTAEQFNLPTLVLRKIKTSFIYGTVHRTLSNHIVGFLEKVFISI